jgi:putative ABC transport system permease protein
MDALVQDLRYALRTLAKAPGFTIVAVLTLALGMGASTAIFSVANGVLLRPLPYADPGQLVMLWETTDQLQVMMVAYPDYLDWRDQNTVFDEVAVYDRYRSMNLTGSGEPERLATGMASANLFRTLGVRLALGRGFRDEEDRAGAARVAIISDGLWQRRFGGVTSVLGQAITLDGNPYTIVGVTPRGFERGGAIDLWVPTGPFVDSSLLSRNNHPGLVAIARMQPGITLQRARDDISRIAGQLAVDYSSRASMWRTCCSPSPPGVHGRSPSAAPWARAAGGWSGSFSPRASCWLFWAERAACCWRCGASRCCAAMPPVSCRA